MSFRSDSKRFKASQQDSNSCEAPRLNIYLSESTAIGEKSRIFRSKKIQLSIFKPKCAKETISFWKFTSFYSACCLHLFQKFSFWQIIVQFILMTNRKRFEHYMIHFTIIQKYFGKNNGNDECNWNSNIVHCTKLIRMTYANHFKCDCNAVQFLSFV